MNLEKVIFGFFIVLAATLNFGFFVGDIENPAHHDVYELFAALVVSRVGGVPAAPREAYRDDSLACGYRWKSAEEAIAYAKNRARELVRKEDHLP